MTLQEIINLKQSLDATVPTMTNDEIDKLYWDLQQETSRDERITSIIYVAAISELDFPRALNKKYKGSLKEALKSSAGVMSPFASKKKKLTTLHILCDTDIQTKEKINSLTKDIFTIGGEEKAKTIIKKAEIMIKEDINNPFDVNIQDYYGVY